MYTHFHLKRVKLACLHLRDHTSII